MTLSDSSKSGPCHFNFFYFEAALRVRLFFSGLGADRTWRFGFCPFMSPLRVCALGRRTRFARRRLCSLAFSALVGVLLAFMVYLWCFTLSVGSPVALLGHLTPRFFCSGGATRRPARRKCGGTYLPGISTIGYILLSGLFFSSLILENHVYSRRTKGG